jgi:hypothetical protein
MNRATFFLFLLLSVSFSPVWGSEPSVTFTEVPEQGQGSGSQGNIAGKVTNLRGPEQYKIVMYAHSDKWYVQPEAENPYTDIGSDGSWSSWMHLGYRYAVLVVRPSFHPSATLRAMPPISPDLVCKKEVPARPLK